MLHFGHLLGYRILLPLDVILRLHPYPGKADEFGAGVDGGDDQGGIGERRAIMNTKMALAEVAGAIAAIESHGDAAALKAPAHG